MWQPQLNLNSPILVWSSVRHRRLGRQLAPADANLHTPRALLPSPRLNVDIAPDRVRPGRLPGLPFHTPTRPIRHRTRQCRTRPGCRRRAQLAPAASRLRIRGDVPINSAQHVAPAAGHSGPDAQAAGTPRGVSVRRVVDNGRGGGTRWQRGVPCAARLGAVSVCDRR